jgi:hypothetical protein
MKIDRSRFPEEWMQYVYLVDQRHENVLRYAKHVFLGRNLPPSLSPFGLIPRLIVMIICIIFTLGSLVDFVLRAVADNQLLTDTNTTASYYGCNLLWLLVPICVAIFIRQLADVRDKAYLVFAEILSSEVVDSKGKQALVLRLQFTNPLTDEKAEHIQRLSIDHQAALSPDTFFAVLVIDSITPHIFPKYLTFVYGATKDPRFIPYVL